MNCLSAAEGVAARQDVQSRRPTMSLPSQDHETAQNCYTMAYAVLPHYIFGQLDTLLPNLSRSLTLGAGFYYVMACRMNETEPREELIRSFPVHAGDLDAEHTYHVIEYPPPPPVDLSPLRGIKDYV